MFAGFSSHGNSIHYIISLFKKEKCRFKNNNSAFLICLRLRLPKFPLKKMSVIFCSYLHFSRYVQKTYTFLSAMLWFITDKSHPLFFWSMEDQKCNNLFFFLFVFFLFFCFWEQILGKVISSLSDVYILFFLWPSIEKILPNKKKTLKTIIYIKYSFVSSMKCIYSFFLLINKILVTCNQWKNLIYEYQF